MKSPRRHIANFARNLDRLIEERQTNYCAVARAAGIDTHLIYNLRDNPGVYNISILSATKIADALNTPLSEMIEDWNNG